MKTKEFFEKRLRAPLVNQGWSWGALDETHNRIFLRVHRNALKPNADSPKRVVLHEPSWSEPSSEEGRRSAGDPERLNHIDLLCQGFEGFAVIYWTFWAGDRWKTKDFDRRFLLRLGKVKNESGTVYAQVLERVPVDTIVGTSANKMEEAEIDDAITRDVPVTDRQALVKARVGQGIFRDQVLRLWSYQCAVTGCGIQEALRASHIKPWSQSTDQERLNPYNGLPLLATLDALFDKHLIAFDPQGKMLLSSDLSKPERDLLLPRKRRLLRKPDGQTARFLREHAALLR